MMPRHMKYLLLLATSFEVLFGIRVCLFLFSASRKVKATIGKQIRSLGSIYIKPPWARAMNMRKSPDFLHEIFS